MNEAFPWLGGVVLGSPALLVAALGGAGLVGWRMSERATNRLTFSTTLVGLTAAVVILAGMLGVDTRRVTVDLGNLVEIESESFRFHVEFVFDRLSVPFVILSFLLCGTVGAFTSRYLHREAGYGRFYVSYALFTLGMVISSVAGTIEVLFFGWELVGLSSALLVAFFQDRPAPSRNGLRVWSVYRIADAAFLIAAVLVHHMTGTGDFRALAGAGVWPEGEVTLTAMQALAVGLPLVLAAAGKSALVPFSGWLPRAMEGPTPSSAIFYGALSVHLGAFLLLRVGAVIEASVVLAGVVVGVGLVTALAAAISARVQTDIKSALAYASLTQVGLIVAEIGLGLRYVALVHIIGHAFLRTLQLLRAPTLLHDYHTIENAVGTTRSTRRSLWPALIPSRAAPWIYRLGIERCHLDDLLDVILDPLRRTFQLFDALERRWTDTLAGARSRESDEVEAEPDIVEEMRL